MALKKRKKIDQKRLNRPVAKASGPNSEKCQLMLWTLDNQFELFMASLDQGRINIPQAHCKE